MRVGLASAVATVGQDPDEPLLVAALARAGAAAEGAPWDVDTRWEDFDLVVLRSTWDYPERRDEFLGWLDRVGSVTELANPPAIVRANTDKRYLATLAAAGVPTVPTTFVDPGSPLAVPDARSFVVKPAVSAGSRNTIRCGPGHRGAAEALTTRLHADGRTVMVQPYVASVDDRGETAMTYFDGAWSHALRKGPLLTEGAGPVEGLHAPEELLPRVPSAREHAVAEAALAALGADDLLYARVDLVEDDDGEPVVLEVELTEPSVFLTHVPEAAERFAHAIVERARSTART
jgi:glutathione synthase/RimK-type ligase-like ATP-grasp enzyme